MKLVLVLAALALCASFTPASVATPSRVEHDRYVAGLGDVNCAVTGIGCVRLEVWGGESSLHFTVADDVHDPVGADVCEPNGGQCYSGFCGEGTITGLRSGIVLFLFLEEARGVLSCGLGLGFATSGWVTTEFS